MRARFLILTACMLFMGVEACAVTFLEVGTESVLLGNGGESGQFLDAVTVRLGSVREISRGRGFGASLTWRWQPSYEGWVPFEPAGGGIDDESCRTSSSPDARGHFFELSFLGCAGGTGGRLRPFGEGEVGCAAISARDRLTGDLFFGVRAGGAWLALSDLNIRATLGYRFYFVSNRFTLPLSVEAHILF